MIAQSKLKEIDDLCLPIGFSMRADGIYHEKEGRDGPTPVWLCSPMRVLALPRDRNNTGWGRLVEVVDPDGRVHRWSIPARMFAGDGTDLRAGLFDLGLNMASDRSARQALSDLLQRWQPPERVITADRLGWCDASCEAFVLGDGTVIGAAHVVYQHEIAPSAAAEMKPAGALVDWRDSVAARCTGNPLLMTALSMGFAGPLLEPLAMEGGGLHLRGASSRGKSTVQRVAASAWGSPGFLHSWRATANGLEGVALACNGSLLTLDELGEISGREAGSAAYMLANGKGKSRADRSGRARSAARWCVMILSSGELSLADKMAESGGKAAAGQDVRLLDISADRGCFGAFDDLHGAPDGATFAERLNRATATAYGTAGPEFVAKFLEDRDGTAARVRASIQEFRQMAANRFGLGDEGQTERAVTRLALIAAAGELAIAWGLTGWPAGAAQAAALDVLGLWLEGRGGGGPAEARDAIERTRAFLIANGEARFERLGMMGERNIINRAGWHDLDTFYISSDAWREIHRGSDPARAARHLHAAGLLETGDGRNITKRLAEGEVRGRPRVYAVKREIMGAGDD